uniref:DB domain-containing protein n=1 Tax=Romanomermis culicivorax TaxID=13658 RepID=A0A915JSI0_ROMCU
MIDTWHNIQGITLDEANEMFRNCCRTIKLPEACMSRLVLFESQDRNACDVIDNIKMIAKCANGLRKQSDVRPCCLKYGAISSGQLNEDPCAYFCHPHGKEDLNLETKHIKCAPKFKRVSYCHFMYLQR